jgi:hypothetical protein
MTTSQTVMPMTRSIVRAVVCLAACAGFGCSDPATSSRPSSIALTGSGDSFSASGDPNTSNGDLLEGSFAVAMEDSVGGMVVIAFRKTMSGGDAFILQFTDRRTGTFECSPGGACHGRLIENITASTTTEWVYWEIQDGTVAISELGDRLVGTVQGMTLRNSAQSVERTQSGTLDLVFLRGEEARRQMYCFIVEARGETCPQ